MVVGGAACGWLLFQQQKEFDRLSQEHEQKFLEHEALVEAQRNSSQVSRMVGILDEVRSFVREHPGDSLPQPMVDRIATLSQSFKPYRYFQGDSLSPTRLSPERGQLLASLAVIGLDSNSFARIKKVTDFSLADMRGVVLPGADFSGAHLRGANLSETKLRHANLRSADLQSALLWAADLDSANLSGVNMRYANAQWALMNGIVMVKGNLNGADIGNAKLRGAYCRKTNFRFAHGKGAMLIEANMELVDFLASDLSKANLTRCDLDTTNLRLVRFADAVMDEISLNATRVGQESWEKVLDEWNWSGAFPLSSKYVLQKDSTKMFEAAYILKSN
ncbi:MAG: pentapeptide repeat-containing protein [Bacteroidia bacterium]